MTPAGKKAQAELIRYYELVDEELAIIRTEMSNNESYNYIAAWKKADAGLLSIRGRWELRLSPMCGRRRSAVSLSARASIISSAPIIR